MNRSLISISPPDRPLARAHLARPGAFLWWYADLIDARGDGAVFIWSFGLPFLPGLASSARRGRPTAPASRPSLNVAIYERGRLACYALQEFAPEQASWQGSGTSASWRFGDSSLSVERAGDEVCGSIDLDLAIPGSPDPLRGTFEWSGPARRAVPGAQPVIDPDHDWTPLMGPAAGALDLRCGPERWLTRGRAYHDRNGGRRPLHALGFSRWVWGRHPMLDREIVYYALWPADGGHPIALGLEIDARGATRRLDGLRVVERDRRRALAGMPYARRLELWHDRRRWLRVRYERLVDDGPFYLRALAWAEHAQGARSVGLAEACRPDRVDRALERPLVRMRVGAAPGGADSIWRPLFTGPRRGRAARLARRALGRRPGAP